MISFAEILFVVLFMLQAAYAAMPPTLDADQAKIVAESFLKSIEEYTSIKVLAAPIIGIGLMLTFSGKRFIKFFLGATGFITFGFASLILVNWLSTFVTIHVYAYLAAFIIGGAAGAALSLKLWKVGILAAAGAGGYYLGMTTSGFALPFLAGAITNNVYNIICAAVAVVLCWFFDNIVLTITSSFTGSFCVVMGSDVYLQYGISNVVAAKINGDIIPRFTEKIYYELAAMIVLFIIGAIVQFVTKANKKGVKSDHV